MKNLYCQLFVDCSLSSVQLLREIVGIVGGEACSYTVAAGWGEIDVLENDDWDALRTDQEDGFLFYRYSNDVVAHDMTNRDRYVLGVIELIEGLRAIGCRVVPACDFEDELGASSQK